MVDLNLCTTRNIIIVHPRFSIFISCFGDVCPRISIYSASTPMSTTTCFRYVHRFMPDSHGAEPEHNMRESLVLFIKMNYEEVNKTARCDAVHMTLVYLRNKVFRDTTVSKKGPPPKYNLSKKCLHLLAHSPHQHQGRNGRENEMRGKQRRPQMPRNLQIWKWMCMPRNPMISLKRKKKINPLPIQKSVRKKLQLSRVKNTKFGGQKKKICHQEMFLIFRKVQFSKRT